MSTSPVEKVGLSQDVNRRIHLWLAGIFALFMAGLLLATYQYWVVALLLGGAMTAVGIAFFGGTQLCLPLYFATTFGGELRIPQIPVSINQGMAMIFLLSVIFDLFRKRIRVTPYMGMILFFMFQVYLVTAAIITRPPGSEWPHQPAFYNFLALAALLFYWDEDRLQWLLRSFVVISVLIILTGVIELFSGRDLLPYSRLGLHGRINGIAVNAIQYSFTAIWAIPLAAYLFIDSKNALTKPFWAMGIASLILLSLATLNRQTPIIMGGVLTVFVIFVRYRHRGLLIAVLIAGVIAAMPYFGYKIVERFQRTGSLARDISFAVRYDKALIAKEMLEEHFIFGVGHNHYKDLWTEYRPIGETLVVQDMWEEELYIDFGYLQILTEYGIVGAFLVLLLFVYSFFLWVRMYRASRRLENPRYTNLLAAVGALFAHLLISLLIQDNLIITRTYLLFGLLFAVCKLVEIELDSREESFPAELSSEENR